MAQMDSVPLKGEAPTTNWLLGEVLVDQYDVIVDPQAPTGNYSIEIGMYDSFSGRRLPLRDASGQAEEDRILLQRVRVLPGN